MHTSPEPGYEEIVASTGFQEEHASRSSVTPLQARPRTHLRNGIRKDKIYTDGTVRYGFLTSTGEPCSIDEALGNEKWKEAMDAEYTALMKNKTWHLVPLQKGLNVIGC
jgi:hypothetical protein